MSFFRPLSGVFVFAAMTASASTAQSPTRKPASFDPRKITTPRTTAEKKAVLNDVSLPYWSTKAPATFIADMETSRGKIAIEFTRAWAPNGVDRFYNLARAGYYDDTRFYRVVSGFVAQFGVAADPAFANYWGWHTIKADPVIEHNVRGTLAYAQFKPTDRSTNVFINLRDSPNLDTLGFTPIGKVIEGMEVADSLFAEYGDLPISDPPLGDPKRMYRETNKYLDAKYPKMDHIIRVTIRP
jgi:peptidyl-prolyl cis-trans isomerase A (cyclophilin A)